uniref:Uncharacterized protein n=1 Tax=Schistocephalus solidus TaxID=70667 RepID=A0A0X3NQG8_SCHSO
MSLKKIYWKHFLLLFTAIRLVRPHSCKEWVPYCRQLLKMFVEKYSSLYGKSEMVYNVHSIVHLPDDVQRHGPLDSFSSFPFESYLGKMKRMLRKPSQPLQQVVRRLGELQAEQRPLSGLSEWTSSYEHRDGPLPPSGGSFTQFRYIKNKIVIVGTTSSNGSLMVGDKLVCVQNIVRYSSGDIGLVFVEYENVEDFFDYPENSSFINVYKATLGSVLKTSPLPSTVRKYACFPLNGHLVLIEINGRWDTED